MVIHSKNSSNFAHNYGGPLHYLGNRYLTLPDISGHMRVDHSWLTDIFSVVLANRKVEKYKRCIEPFAGSASWSLAAMEIGLAEEYIVNDGNSALMDTHRLIQTQPDKVKESYSKLVQEYNKTSAKKDFFIEIIKGYNQADQEYKFLFLPFIINHSWGGIVFYDKKNNLAYREHNIKGKIIPGYLDKANLTLDMFLHEIDRVSQLLNSNKVAFQSGDFQNVLTNVRSDDFININPPYPENEEFKIDEAGIFVELYAHEILYEKLKGIIEKFEQDKIDYFMTYGFYHPKRSQFILRKDNQPRNFFNVLGYENCAFDMALDQIYFNSKFFIPHELTSKIIWANDILEGKLPSPEEALETFARVSKIM